MIRRIAAIMALTAFAALGAGAGSAVAASPAWQVLAVTGPTHLPPVADEIQKVSVDAEGGTFTLAFGAQSTAPIAFDAGPADLEAALNALSTIGGVGGGVEVSGGPGGMGAAHPYFVRFGGSLAATNVEALNADSGALTGGVAHSATVATRAQGGANGTGEIAIAITSVGGAASNGAPVTAGFTLPAGIVPTSTSLCSVAGQAVSCSRSVTVAPGQTTDSFQVPVQITAAAPTSSEVEVTVGGGGAAGVAVQMPITVSATPAGPGIQSLWAGAYDEDGAPFTQAGGHPASAGTGFMLNTIFTPSGKIAPVGDIRDLEVELPPGFLGNPLVTARCPQDNLGDCGDIARVGLAKPFLQSFGGETTVGVSAEDVFNDIPSFGYPAQFTFKLFEAKANIVGSLRSDRDYGVTVTAPNIPTSYRVYGATTVLEGSPSAAAGKAFLTQPTDCAETAPVTAFSGRIWQAFAPIEPASVPVPPVIGCDQLEFEADLKARPTTKVADSPTGLDVELTMPQESLTDPDELANPHLRHTTVELPEGIAINPSGANGLDGCSSEEIGLIGTGFELPNPIRFDKSPVACPDASKVGLVEVETPLLDKTLKGAVYVADPYDNPFDSLVAIYLVIDDPETGIVVKLPGTVDLDPETGRITSTFENNPQLPFSQLRLDFKSGAHAPLSTPPACGDYATTSTLTPWSAPDSGPPLASVDGYRISRGPGAGGSCVRSAGALPNSPTFEAGTSAAIAGAYAPFVVDLSRPDGSQRFRDVTVKPPPGMVARLAGIPYCSEAALVAAASLEGRAEQASPSCPAASRLGGVHTRAGSGPDPFNAPGAAYLTGPYKGAPLSMAVITPAVSGPFDLGTVVVRVALHVNPATAEITAVTDPLPAILEGIPLNIRSASVRLDRPQFTRNPTNCEPLVVGGSLISTLGGVAALSDRFQLGECARLGFKPRTSVRLFGGVERGKYQGVRAVVRPRPGDANISRTVVRFPRSAFVAQEHLKDICTRVQYAADACPKRSVYGKALAYSPLLDYPLQGNVYLRSSDNALPDLVADLRGPAHQPIRIEVAVRNDSVKGALRNTVQAVPDAPVSYFRLQTFGGNKGLIVNSRNICKGRNRAKVVMGAHNGRHSVQDVNVFNKRCKRFKRKAKHKRNAAHKRRG